MQPLYDNLLVKVASETNDKMKVGSLELFIPQGRFLTNQDGAPVQAQTKGVVVQIPLGLYECAHIMPEAKVGDTVYFHYNSISKDSLAISGYGEDIVYRIPYSMIFCVVREGCIIPIGSRVFCEPYYDKDVKEIEHEGVTMKVREKNGIIIETNASHDLTKAKLAHIGSPNVGAKKLACSSGDIVWYEKDADFPNEIEGKKLFVMKQEDLIMYEKV